MKIVFELPFYNHTVGGVNDTISLSSVMGFDTHVRFQNKTQFDPPVIPHSFGMADATFPECDVCITYSDNPYLNKLVLLPQVKKVIIYMLSYGMCYEREIPNVLNKNVTVICSSKKIEKEIIKDGGKVTRVGFGLDLKDFKNENNNRGNFLSLIYHDAPGKRYDLAVEVADMLYLEGIVDGVITFGKSDNYNNFKKPKGLRTHFSNANRKEIREIFNSCKAFLMPSISEGLNQTPIESALCGCPSVIVDGAINEIFYDKVNCHIAEKDNKKMMYEKLKELVLNYDKYSYMIDTTTRKIIEPYTWERVAENIKKIL